MVRPGSLVCAGGFELVAAQPKAEYEWPEKAISMWIILNLPLGALRHCLAGPASPSPARMACRPSPPLHAQCLYDLLREGGRGAHGSGDTFAQRPSEIICGAAGGHFFIWNGQLRQEEVAKPLMDSVSLIDNI